MKRKLKVFAISGSTRIDSTNESILKLIAEQFSKVAELEIFKQLSLLPHFNPDMKGDNVPDIVKESLFVQEKIRADKATSAQMAKRFFI